MLIQVLLNYASQWHKGRLICLITRSHIQPFMAKGWVSWSSDDETMRMLVENRFLLDKNQRLRALIDQGVSTYGPPQALGFDELLEGASVMMPEMLVLIPIVLGGKTKMLFVGERDQPPKDMEEFTTDVDPLASVCAHVAQQLERLILAAKQGTLPPEERRVPTIPKARQNPSLTHLSRPTYASEASDPQSTTDLSLGLAHSSTEGSQKPAAPRVTTQDQAARQTQPISLEDLRAHQREHSLQLTKTSPQAPPLELDMASSPDPAAGGGGLEEGTGGPDEGEDEAIVVPPGSVSYEDQERSGVFISQPIPIEDKDSTGKKTLIGGYSKEDIERAKALFLKQSAGKDTLRGVQAPLVPGAQIFKRKKGASQEVIPPPVETQKMVVVVLDDDAKHAPPPPSVATQNFKLDFSSLPDPSTQRLDALSKTISQPQEVGYTPTEAFKTSRGRQFSPLLERQDSEAVSSLPKAPLQPGGEAPSAPSEPRSLEQDVSEANSSPPALPQGPASSEAQWLEELEGRDLKKAFAAASKLKPEAKVLEALSKAFPGRLVKDRYQYPVEHLPDVSLHGPLLKALVHMGQQAAGTVAEHLNSSSLDRRFYATFLFTRLDPEPHLLGLVPRLFDRDSQTRDIAFDLVLGRRKSNVFRLGVLPELHHVLESSSEEFRVEITADLLGCARSLQSIDPLIAALEHHRDRTNQAIHRALQRITLQPLPPATIAWQSWRGQHPTLADRNVWIVVAMNSPNATIREYVHEELAQAKIEGLNYSPDAPSNVRVRAQQALQEWLDTHPGL